MRPGNLNGFDYWFAGYGNLGRPPRRPRRIRPRSIRPWRHRALTWNPCAHLYGEAKFICQVKHGLI